MRTIATILLLCTVAAPQDLPEAPEPQPTPHLETTRPAIEPPDHPDAKPVERHKWLKRTVEFGSASVAAKVADDSCDFIVGPTKARYVGAAAAVTTFLIVHHYLHRRKAIHHPVTEPQEDKK